MAFGRYRSPQPGRFTHHDYCCVFYVCGRVTLFIYRKNGTVGALHFFFSVVVLVLVLVGV